MASRVPWSRVPRARILYLGAPGDAGAFRARYRIGLPVLSDLAGDQARAVGVVQCPAVVLASKGPPRVYGNGTPMDAAQLGRVVAELEKP